MRAVRLPARRRRHALLLRDAGRRPRLLPILPGLPVRRLADVEEGFDCAWCGRKIVLLDEVDDSEDGVVHVECENPYDDDREADG